MLVVGEWFSEKLAYELKLNFHSNRSTLLYMWPFVIQKILHIYFQEEQSDQAPDVTRIVIKGLYSIYTHCSSSAVGWWKTDEQ